MDGWANGIVGALAGRGGGKAAALMLGVGAVLGAGSITYLAVTGGGGGSAGGGNRESTSARQADRSRRNGDTPAHESDREDDSGDNLADGEQGVEDDSTTPDHDHENSAQMASQDVARGHDADGLVSAALFTAVIDAATSPLLLFSQSLHASQVALLLVLSAVILLLHCVQSLLLALGWPPQDEAYSPPSPWVWMGMGAVIGAATSAGTSGMSVGPVISGAAGLIGEGAGALASVVMKAVGGTGKGGGVAPHSPLPVTAPATPATHETSSSQSAAAVPPTSPRTAPALFRGSMAAASERNSEDVIVTPAITATGIHLSSDATVRISSAASGRGRSTAPASRRHFNPPATPPLTAVVGSSGGGSAPASTSSSSSLSLAARPPRGRLRNTAVTPLLPKSPSGSRSPGPRERGRGRLQTDEGNISGHTSDAESFDGDSRFRDVAASLSSAEVDIRPAAIASTVIAPDTNATADEPPYEGDLPMPFAKRLQSYIAAADALLDRKDFVACSKTVEAALSVLERASSGDATLLAQSESNVDAVLPPPAFSFPPSSDISATTSPPPLKSRLLAALLWRRGRLCSLTAANPSITPPGSKLERFRSGLSDVLRSLQLHEPEAEAHKWAAILYERSSGGTKETIANGYKIKEHALVSTYLSYSTLARHCVYLVVTTLCISS